MYAVISRLRTLGNNTQALSYTHHAQLLEYTYECTMCAVLQTYSPHTMYSHTHITNTIVTYLYKCTRAHTLPYTTVTFIPTQTLTLHTPTTTMLPSLAYSLAVTLITGRWFCRISGILNLYCLQSCFFWLLETLGCMRLWLCNRGLTQ